jgi:hypothetical protein
MSSGNKPSRKTRRARSTPSAVETSRRTSASSRRSLALVPAPVQALADFARAMRAARLRWYVFGAQAAVAYGRPRMTADIDVAVAKGRASAKWLVDALEKAGVSLRVALSKGFLRDARLLPMVHVPTGMPMDVILIGAGLQEEFVARRRSVDVGGVRVPMISAEDLVATKVLAGRRKDMEDVRGVLLEQRRLDLARIRDVLRRLATALDDDRLLPRFERLLRTARARAARPVAADDHS